MTSTIRVRRLKRKFIHPSRRKGWSTRGTKSNNHGRTTTQCGTSCRRRFQS